VPDYLLAALFGIASKDFLDLMGYMGKVFNGVALKVFNGVLSSVEKKSLDVLGVFSVLITKHASGWTSCLLMLREERTGWRAIGCVCGRRARLVLL
jgi:hypothetical protein